MVDSANSRTVPKYLGKIKLKKGEVFRVDEEGNRQALEGGGKVLTGDTIETGALSFVSVEIIDDSLISLGPNSQFQFEESVFKEKKDRKMIYRFVKGQMRAQIPIKARPGDLQFRSKSTTLGIEGTIFLANSFANPDGADVFECAVLEGKVAAKSVGIATVQTVLPGQHFVYMKKGETIDQGMKILPEDVSQEMISREADVSRDLLPLLDQYALTYVNETSGRIPASVNGAQAPINAGPLGTKQIPKQTWRDSLKGLNDILDDYNSIDDGMPVRH